jgi:hypothetical protein
MRDRLADFQFVKAYKPILRLSLGKKAVRGGVSGAATKWVLCILLDRAATGNWPVAYSVLGTEAGGLSVSVVKRAVRRLQRAGLIEAKKKGWYGITYEVDRDKVLQMIQQSLIEEVRRKDLGRKELNPRSNRPTSNTETYIRPNGSSLSGHRSDPNPNPGDSLKITKGLEEPGPRSDRIDRADDADRPGQVGEGESEGEGSEFDTDSNVVPFSIDEDDPQVPEPAPGIETQDDDEKPPPDKARLNGWHPAKVKYYRVTFPGGGRPNEQSADITDPSELDEWKGMGCKVEEFFKEETVDKAGRVVRPEAVEEEKEKQEKFRERMRQRRVQAK